MDTEEEEEDDPAQTFDLGRFCAEKAYFHHSLRREYTVLSRVKCS